MASTSSSTPPFLKIILCLISISLATTCIAFSNEAFLQCLHLQTNTSTMNLSKLLYFPKTTSYASLLLSSISNTRFTTPSTPKPLLNFKPTLESHIQASVFCSRYYSLSLRVRSGGHDFEGLSYQSPGHQPFIVVDLTNFRSVTVDVKLGMAWVQAGATIGELYYHIASNSSTFGFPAGTCSTVGVGGHISGGGVGTLVRKYGLAADNVLDVRFVDVHGRILDKNSMGEDLFWAVRGGGAASFGVVVSWKLRLVPVPQTVTRFNISKTSLDGAIDLIDKWQHIAHNLTEDLFIEMVLQTLTNGSKGVEVLFKGLFLGKSSGLLQVMGEKFPELGVGSKDCEEMSWVQSVMSFTFFPTDSPLEILLDRKLQQRGMFKAKSDYAVNPIPRGAIKNLWNSLMEVDAAYINFQPYGGKMAEIPESQLPFPHRKGSLFNIIYLVAWSTSDKSTGTNGSERENQIGWIRRLYKNMDHDFRKIIKFQNYLKLLHAHNGVYFSNNNIWYHMLKICLINQSF